MCEMHQYVTGMAKNATYFLKPNIKVVNVSVNTFSDELRPCYIQKAKVYVQLYKRVSALRVHVLSWFYIHVA